MNCFNEENVSSSEEARRNFTFCEYNSLDICDRTIYSQPISSFNGYQYNQYKKATLKLVIASFEYPAFKETRKWTVSSFIGVFGGALGLWLGINILNGARYTVRAMKKFTSSGKTKHAKSTVAKSVKNVNENSVGHGNVIKHEAVSSPKRYAKES